MIEQMLKLFCVKSVQIRSFCRSVFSRIRTEYGEILSIFSPNAVKYDQKKLRIWTLFTQCSEYALYPLN